MLTIVERTIVHFSVLEVPRLQTSIRHYTDVYQTSQTSTGQFTRSFQPLELQATKTGIRNPGCYYKTPTNLSLMFAYAGS